VDGRAGLFRFCEPDLNSTNGKEARTVKTSFTYVLSCAALIGTCLQVHAASGAENESAVARLHGVVLDQTGTPLAGATVTVQISAEGNPRTVLTTGNGEFELASLAPGHYEVTAAKNGLATQEPVAVDIAVGSSTDIDVPLGGESISAVSTPKKEGFIRRFLRAYADDWRPATGQDVSPAPKFRGYPAPVEGPPFPFTVWPYGGSVTIGQPWTQAGPLMTAIWGGSNGDAWKRSGIQIYGWLNAGTNVSTSRGGGYSNFPEAYAEREGIQLDQEVLYIERQPDTVQTDHVDWGFRVSGLYGLDYRFTTSQGFLSNQLLGKNQENGFDSPMFYFDLYVPQIAQGTDIRVGRYISLPDIEAQLAPNNYTYSHSLTYTFDCYTRLGINSTTKVTSHWLFQVGLSPGCDTMPWTKSAKPTVNTCLGYTWRNGLDNIYGCDNSINDGRYAYNNLQAFYLTWYHKFSAGSKWHSATESWYQYESHTPNVDNPAGQALLITGANGAICKTLEQVTCYAPDYAIVNYIEYQTGKHDYLSFRNEFFDDFVGQRTGFKTFYTEHMIGWGHWVGTTILFRPELRFERSYSAPAYDNGTRKNQLTLASDVILFF
jgi:hypothetical protein